MRWVMIVFDLDGDVMCWKSYLSDSAIIPLLEQHCVYKVIELPSGLSLYPDGTKLVAHELHEIREDEANSIRDEV